MAENIRTGVVGVGNFGIKHAEKLAGLPGSTLVAVADRDRDRAQDAGRRFNVRWTTDCRELIGEVDAVNVVVPTAAHYDVAQVFLDSGIHVLVEKPIASRVEHGRALADLADRRGLVFQVGHIEHFSPVFEALRDIVRRPLYIESNRISVFTGRSVDVNVILDLMIHDIELVMALVDAPVESVDAVGAPVITEYEDIANTRVLFANGCAANITASRISHKTERVLRIFQPDEYTVADLQDLRLVRFRKTDEDASGFPIPYERHEETIVHWDSLEREIAGFLAAIAESRPPRVSGWQATEALRTALMIERSLSEHRARIVQGKRRQ